MAMAIPTVETLRKSQMFSLTWNEPNLSNSGVDSMKRLPNLELIPRVLVSVTYYNRDESPNASFDDAAYYYPVNQHPRSSGQNKQVTNPLIHMNVALHGVDRLPKVDGPTSSPITIIARKDGVRPKSFEEEIGTSTTRRWRAIWETCCRSMNHTLKCCGCGRRTETSFEVLINFGNVTNDDHSFMGPGQRNVLQHMEKLLDDQHLADITFKFPGGTELKAHSIVLAAGSPVLAAMLSHDMKESKSRVVEIKDASVEIFQQVLQYLYTGKAKEKEMLGTELLVVADKYQIQPLKEECAALLTGKLDVTNAAKMLVLSYLHNCPGLHQSTLNFIARNGEAVGARLEWLELMKSYPELCFQASQRMLARK